MLMINFTGNNTHMTDV